MGTVIQWTLTGIGAVTLLAALGLCGLAWREAGICRHIDAQTKPVLYDQDAEEPLQDWPELVEWERDIRTPDALEDWLEQETGQ